MTSVAVVVSFKAMKDGGVCVPLHVIDFPLVLYACSNPSDKFPMGIFFLSHNRGCSINILGMDFVALCIDNTSQYEIGNITEYTEIVQ